MTFDVLGSIFKPMILYFFAWFLHQTIWEKY